MLGTGQVIREVGCLNIREDDRPRRATLRLKHGTALERVIRFPILDRDSRVRDDMRLIEGLRMIVAGVETECSGREFDADLRFVA